MREGMTVEIKYHGRIDCSREGLCFERTVAGRDYVREGL